MPNCNWSNLTSLQLGRYAEYYAKMEFASYGFEVYSSEVDDHGVDFIVKVPSQSKFYEVQVKSKRDNGYVMIDKTKMRNLTDDRLVCFLRFVDDTLPEVYIIPATAWNAPNALFVEHNYGKPDQTSTPEWGMNISNKNLPLLSEYIADSQLNRIIQINCKDYRV